MARIVFFAEGVTSAHIFRPLQLATYLAGRGHDVHLATTMDHPVIHKFPGANLVKLHFLTSKVAPEKFASDIAKGKIPFSKEIIQFYWREDQELLEKLHPDFVVDDFRLSLSISTEMMNIPHMTLNHITWTSLVGESLDPIPDISLVKALGPKLGGWIFRMAKPQIEHKILKPFNRIRKQLGLRTLERIFDLYSSGAYVGFLDSPHMLWPVDLEENQMFLGPLLFSYPQEIPESWKGWQMNANNVYVSLGSSGPIGLLPEILEVFSKKDCQVLVSTSGRDVDLKAYPNIKVAKYVPDSEILKHCKLYIGNGGSGGLHQALGSGVPSISLPENYDQWLYSSMLENLGLTHIARPSQFSSSEFSQKVDRVLNDRYNKEPFMRIINTLPKWDPGKNLETFIQQKIVKKPIAA